MCGSDLYTCLVVLSDEEERADGGGSASQSSEAAPSQAAAPAAVAIADLGSLCLADFKVSADAAVVCEEVARFAAPSYVVDLFRNMSLKGMF